MMGITGARVIEHALPLKRVEMLVLMTLSSERTEGFALLGDPTECPDGRIQVAQGNLRSVLGRLVTAGLVETSERRRNYRVTSFGLSVLSGEATRLLELVVKVRALNLVGDGVTDRAANP